MLATIPATMQTNTTRPNPFRRPRAGGWDIEIQHKESVLARSTRQLNAEGIPTRKESARWERSTVWAVLRNPAYRGAACFGKTRVSGRARVMRPQRRRGVTMPSMTVGHERPREEWIEIPVPALVSEESFARAQELLHENKIRSRRRTIERAGAGQLPEVWLRLLAYIDVHERAQDPLLQVHWLRWLAKAGRSCFATTAASFDRTCWTRLYGPR